MHQRVEEGSGRAGGRLGGIADDLTGLLAGMQPWQLTSEQVLRGIDTAYRLATVAHTMAIRLVAEADRRKLPVDQGASCTAAWLTHTQRIRPSQARRDLLLAQLIGSSTGDGDGAGDGARVEGAVLGLRLAAGRLNLDQAGVIATGLGELPVDASPSTRLVAERLLVEEAQFCGPATLTRVGHTILERIDPDAADRRLGELLDREAREADRLRTGTRHVDGHGSVFYRFRLPVGDDAWIRPVLDTLAAPDPAVAGRLDGRTATQRLADAFVETFRRAQLAGDLPAAGGDRPRALITVSLDQLRTGLGAGRLVDTGDDLSIDVIRRLCCDAQIIPAVLGGPSQILDLGRARRTFDGPIRLAVIARDRGCIHPGCTRPARWCDVHHVTPWWNGGPTSLHNGVLVCGFHHKLYDAGSWQIHFAPDGTPESIPPYWIDLHQRPRRHERHHETDRT
jgi:hypothetical protein